MNDLALTWAVPAAVLAGIIVLLGSVWVGAEASATREFLRCEAHLEVCRILHPAPLSNVHVHVHAERITQDSFCEEPEEP